jgi:two-component system, sensor histidine kinase PdtaS
VAIYALATGLAVMVLPGMREALFICYLPAIVMTVLLGGSYAGLGVAIAGGLSIWYWLYPMALGQEAMLLTLYVDAAVVLLYVMDLLNRSIDALIAERDRARLLFREAQHRTANNLMFISGFLRAERKAAQKDPAKAAQSLNVAVQRLEMFSSVHRRLSGAGERGETLPLLFRRLCDGLVEAAGADHVTVSMEIAPAELDFEQTVILSLLFTEIVTNALKHAFAGRERGALLIRLTPAPGMYIFEVHDDGAGLDGPSGGGTGHHLMHMLAAQLGGTLTMANEGGLHTRLVFPRRAGAAGESMSLGAARAAPAGD